VRKALSAPARQIALNAGEDGSVVVGMILGDEQPNFSIDAKTGKYTIAYLPGPAGSRGEEAKLRVFCKS